MEGTQVLEDIVEHLNYLVGIVLPLEFFSCEIMNPILFNLF